MMVKYEVIGRNNVAVPTHFFKVLLLETDCHEFDMISFVLPNQVLTDQCPLKQYVVPVDAIERSSGLLIFDKLARNRLRQINNVQLVDGFVMVTDK